MRKTRDLKERFLSYREVLPNGCWLWTGFLDRDGYGHIRRGGIGGRRIGAHKAAYELYKGPVPDGMEVDHLCGMRNCVNPDHLEVVSHQTNSHRANSLLTRTYQPNNLYTACKEALKVFEEHPELPDETRQLLRCAISRADSMRKAYIRKHS